jgi:hypothetical protein
MGTIDRVRQRGIEDEKRVIRYLRKKRFKIEHPKDQVKPSNKPYDILAKKNKTRWAIEVKGGGSPPIKLENFKKMLSIKNIDMIGLALVIDEHPFLLSFNKRTHSGEIAWMRKRKKGEEWSSKYHIKIKK